MKHERLTCRDCAYFYDRAVAAGPMTTAGECRLNPPIIDRSSSVWPEVESNDWCGQLVLTLRNREARPGPP